MTYENSGSALSPAFIDRMQGQLGADAASFFESLDSESPVSIFINPFKDPVELSQLTEPIPWCSYGRYLNHRPEFTFDPLFHAGCYYVMEASSMFLSHVLSTMVSESPIRALDLCGAPGGKSVVTLSSLPQGSVLVSNEVIKSRFQTLQYNLDKWGAPNVIRTSLDPLNIPWSGFFDLILVDAPCSGEGLFRKDKEARKEWTPEHVLHCSARQRRILAEAERLLAPGGLLIYSTCTYNDEENISQVRWMSGKFGLTPKRIPLTDAWNITEIQSGDAVGYQFYPHRLKGEGFFCAILEKDRDTESQGESLISKSRGHKPFVVETQLPQDFAKWIKPDAMGGECRCFISQNGDYYLLQSAPELNLCVFDEVRYPGTELGGLKISARADINFRKTEGSRETPSHALALSTILDHEAPSVELSGDQAIAYLRKDPLQITCETSGWNVARHKSFALGWLKQTQAGLKNYLPTKYRIIKQQTHKPINPSTYP